MFEDNILASRTIHTRGYHNPDPPEIVENPEIILRKSPTPRRPTISGHIHRANSAPKDFTALSDPLFDLDSQKRLPTTRSFSALDQLDLQFFGSPSHSGQHIKDRGTPPSTPPDIHFIQNLGLCHPKLAQQTSASPSIPVIHIPAAQPNPLHPQNIIMAAWYAPMVFPQPLVPLSNDYESKIPHFTAKESTTAQHHVDRMEDSFDYMEIDDETVKMRIFA